MTTTKNVSPTPDAEVTEPEAASTRRAALRALALGGGAAAVGVVAFGQTASADDEDPILLGNSALAVTNNTSSTPTTVVHTPAAAPEDGPSALSVSGGALTDAPFPANVGGYGNDLVIHGVHGSTTNGAGYGVVAANLSPDAPGEGEQQPAGLAVASANGPQIQFLALEGAVEGPTAGPHENGELYMDAVGTLWYTVDGPLDTPRFVKLAGAGTAGSFHVINPQRAYDSRQSGYAVNGVLARNTNRVISVADGHSSNGTVTLPNAVPAGATAVQINLTAADPTGPNFLAATSGDVESTQTSALNWTAGVTQIANSITVPLNATRQIRVYCGDQTGSTHFIVDVFGYYL